MYDIWRKPLNRWVNLRWTDSSLFIRYAYLGNHTIDRTKQTQPLLSPLWAWWWWWWWRWWRRNNSKYVCFVFVIRQLVESRNLPVVGEEQERSPSERILSHIMTNYEPDIKPENGQPHEPLKVEFGLAVLCAELYQSDGLLRTYGWQMMVSKTNGE